ncbi:MAG: hypothetical protein J3R72DRAFT_505125 [Linnemannia gamsii]|nr:MAG: hypothetical protein J3R72DRAFT_505125 [Linnemannia gamsii]
MTNEIPFQSLRCPASDKIVQVQAHYHSETRQNVIFWDDILQLFPRVRYLLDGKVIVSGARNASLHLVMTTPASMPPESLYASSVCSEETTSRNQFQRLHVPTETEASDKSDSGNEIIKVEEVEIHYPRPHVPRTTEASDKFDSEREGDTTAQESFEERQFECIHRLLQQRVEYYEQRDKLAAGINILRQTLPDENQISPTEAKQSQGFNRDITSPSNIFGRTFKAVKLPSFKTSAPWRNMNAFASPTRTTRNKTAMTEI